MTVVTPNLQWLDDPRLLPADPVRPACWVIDTSRHSSQTATLLRQVLGMQLGVPPHAVELETDALGRRVLSQSTTRTVPRALLLDFSISHCPGTLVIAVCSGQRIGVDVEVVAPPGWEATARDCLTLAEQQWLQNEADQPASFLRLWTAKEAIAKALGLGMQADFAGIELQPRELRLHVLRVQHSQSLAVGWTLDSMDLLRTGASSTVGKGARITSGSSPLGEVGRAQTVRPARKSSSGSSPLGEVGRGLESVRDREAAPVKLIFTTNNESVLTPPGRGIVTVATVK